MIMKEVLGVWRDTRLVVMIAVTAALYAAILIPMKIIMPLVPGFTEVRPANVLPILFSFLFGPVAAWGALIEFTGWLCPLTPCSAQLFCPHF